MRALPKAAALLLSVSLGGCGLLADPSTGLTFKPPDGWSSPIGLNNIKLWNSSQRRYEFVLLHKLKSGFRYDYAHLFTSEAFKGTFLQSDPARIQEIHTIKICGGGQDATYIRGVKKYQVVGDESVEATFTIIGDTTYSARYIHPLNAKPNGQAEASLRELCAK